MSVGVKTDPIETRYSYEWLFGLLSEEGIRHVQIGTFFELYQLPDEFFIDLRCQAEAITLRQTPQVNKELVWELVQLKKSPDLNVANSLF